MNDIFIAALCRYLNLIGSAEFDIREFKKHYKHANFHFDGQWAVLVSEGYLVKLSGRGVFYWYVATSKLRSYAKRNKMALIPHNKKKKTMAEFLAEWELN